MYSDLRVASSEIAKALKGGASPTTEEINDIKELLSGNMGTDKAKAVFQHFARNLYEKNESEALNFYRATGYKPDPIYTDAAAQWLNQSMGIDLSTYYNYQWMTSESSWPSTQEEQIKDIYSSMSNTKWWNNITITIPYNVISSWYTVENFSNDLSFIKG